MTPLSLYVHWPFCLQKCPYCDFNSHVREGIAPARWVAALLAEMAHWREKTGPRQLATLFFGGGTPSLMPPNEVARLIARAHELWPGGKDVEVTLEANPTSSDAEKFCALHDAGVNRLSLGVQALDDEALAFLGRAHSVDDALRALHAARAIFPRVSFDLIYARKSQSVSMWEAELRRALALAGTHLSLYQLTIEPGTVFANKTAAGAVFQADDDAAADMYELTLALTREAGLPAYEVSNHAAPGQACRHNLAYWRYRDYVGIGPGAHGRVVCDGARRATRTLRPPEAWLRQVEARGHGLEAEDTLSHHEEMQEAFLMGLRLFDGIARADWDARFALPLAAFMDEKAASHLIGEGLLINDAEHVRVTQTGMLRLTAITGMLMKDAA